MPLLLAHLSLTSQQPGTRESCKNSHLDSLVFQHIIVGEIYDVLQKSDSWKPYAFKHLYNKEDYYMLSYLSDHAEADIYGENIALLTSDKRVNVKNLVVGDIPSWTSINVTSNVSNSNNFLIC